MKNFCAGANIEGFHYINMNVKDINYDLVGDISNYKSEDDINRTIKTYKSLKTQVEIVNNSNDRTIRNAIIPDLIERVDIINKTIEKNKNNYDSWWVNIFYSEEIGKLEPLRVEY